MKMNDNWLQDIIALNLSEEIDVIQNYCLRVLKSVISFALKSVTALFTTRCGFLNS
jgi:hypothetical protein